jgi:DNA polymerase-3 subunit gamma/tau
MLAFRPARPRGRARAGRAPSADPEAPGGGSAAAAADPPPASPWAQIVSQLELTGAARQLASHCAFLGRQGNVVRLALDPRNQLVRTAATEEKLTQALARHFGAPVRLEFQAVAAGAETPALLARRASEAELETARRVFEADPAVKAMRDRFGASVRPDRAPEMKPYTMARRALSDSHARQFQPDEAGAAMG